MQSTSVLHFCSKPTILNLSPSSAAIAVPILPSEPVIRIRGFALHSRFSIQSLEAIELKAKGSAATLRHTYHLINRATLNQGHALYFPPLSILFVKGRGGT